MFPLQVIAVELAPDGNGWLDDRSSKSSLTPQVTDPAVHSPQNLSRYRSTQRPWTCTRLVSRSRPIP